MSINAKMNRDLRLVAASPTEPAKPALASWAELSAAAMYSGDWDDEDESAALTLGMNAASVSASPTAPQQETGVDLDRIAKAVREILLAVGEDPDREGLVKTPGRVARMYAEVFQGLKQNPRDHLKTMFTEIYGDAVIIRDIPFVSFCEHHLLPFLGKVHVAYLPNGKVVGLSKVPRVIDGFAKRPQLQERLTTEVADALYSELNAQGVAVLVEATHSCMTIRGVGKPGSSCWTFAMRGVYQTDLDRRAEILSLIRGQ